MDYFHEVVCSRLLTVPISAYTPATIFLDGHPFATGLAFPPDVHGSGLFRPKSAALSRIPPYSSASLNMNDTEFPIVRLELCGNPGDYHLHFYFP